MSSSKIRNYDNQCMFELISAIINEEEIPKWQQNPKWDSVYKTADYHNLSNILFYGTICMDSSQETGWKNKFTDKYQQSVRNHNRYMGAIPELLEGFESAKVYVMVIKGYTFKEYYPMPEMKELKTVDLLVEKGKSSQIEKIFTKQGYDKQINNEEGYEAYYKSPGVLVHVYNQLNFEGSKIKKHFITPMKKYPSLEGYEYIKVMSPEDFYVYVVSLGAEEFAKGRLDIRDVLDIWCYYLKVYEQLDFTQINKIMDGLDINKFHTLLIQLGAFWFGGMLFPENNQLFGAMEEYIMSKGTKQRELCGSILPLIIELSDKYDKELSEKRKKQALEWIMPPIEYMDGMFEILKKHPKLLPVFWVIRLFRIGFRSVARNVKFAYSKFIDVTKPARICIINTGKQLQDWFIKVTKFIKSHISNLVQLVGSIFKKARKTFKNLVKFKKNT